MASKTQIGWGVLGCAGIAAKTCAGIAEADKASVVAVASRSLAKAETFIEANAVGAKAYGRYEAILDDDNVDVVYIPLPTTMKKYWVVKAAQKGKHVLCEKPLAANVEDARSMIEACAKAGVQFMDNTMMMHHDRLKEIKKVLNNKDTFGAVKHVVSCFTIPFGNDQEWAKDNIRMNASTEPLGALGDLGWYNIRISQWAFDYEDPEEVSCHYSEENADGLPVVAHAVLRYSGGRTATFDCSFKCSLRQWAEVVGEKCTVSWDDLCVTQLKEEAPFTVATAGIGDLAITFPKEVIETKNVKGCVQHSALVRNMSELVKRGEPDPCWPMMALQTQEIMMALHESARQEGSWVRLDQRKSCAQYLQAFCGSGCFDATPGDGSFLEQRERLMDVGKFQIHALPNLSASAMDHVKRLQRVLSQNLEKSLDGSMLQGSTLETPSTAFRTPPADLLPMLEKYAGNPMDISKFRILLQKLKASISEDDVDKVISTFRTHRAHFAGSSDDAHVDLEDFISWLFEAP